MWCGVVGGAARRGAVRCGVAWSDVLWGAVGWSGAVRSGAVHGVPRCAVERCAVGWCRVLWGGGRVVCGGVSRRGVVAGGVGCCRVCRAVPRCVVCALCSAVRFDLTAQTPTHM